MSGVEFFAVYCAAVLLAIVVTWSLYRSSGVWAQRIGRSRWRYANLPVGGSVALVLYVLIGWPVFVPIAVGFAAGAVGGRVYYPLPAVPNKEV